MNAIDLEVYQAGRVRRSSNYRLTKVSTCNNHQTANSDARECRRSEEARLLTTAS